MEHFQNKSKEFSVVETIVETVAKATYHPPIYIIDLYVICFRVKHIHGILLSGKVVEIGKKIIVHSSRFAYFVLHKASHQCMNTHPRLCIVKQVVQWFAHFDTKSSDLTIADRCDQFAYFFVILQFNFALWNGRWIQMYDGEGVSGTGSGTGRRRGGRE